MAMDAKQFDIFISHSNQDTEWCEQLAEGLRDAGLRVQLDKWQMRDPGIDLIAAMEDGLAQSSRALLVLTPDYLNEENSWAPAERRSITYDHFTHRRGFAIPLLLKDCTIPPLLRPLNFLDFRNKNTFHKNLQNLINILRNTSPIGTALSISDLSLQMKSALPR